MLRIYKKIIVGGAPKQDSRLDAPEQTIYLESSSLRSSSWLSILLMVAGAVVGMFFFSIFIVVLLIPVGILAVRAWWLLRKARNNPIDQSIDAEYTVIEEKSKK